MEKPRCDFCEGHFATHKLNALGKTFYCCMHCFDESGEDETWEKLKEK